ncbi:transglycosylase SLT domain-containing protein [Marimonas sp. MJW-29]|uniref:Transglycosylase SLT domain-containing protein n=1 Tax=Sulfitobacter sediminis TaxID=3234186 RepID=A0ABV3RKI5_9RHOB
MKLLLIPFLLACCLGARVAEAEVLPPPEMRSEPAVAGFAFVQPGVGFAATLVPTSRFGATLRPPVRPATLPQTRWQHMEDHALWTRAALSALKAHGKPLVDLVPGDIGNWCPRYPEATEAERRAFWVGFMSALAKHESTYRPWAVGGGGKWYGLLQILPATARGYKCNARTGQGLKNGAANLSCAVRIMARTVPRDGVIHGYRGRKGQGVTADWGPMHSASKRRDMAGWLKEQAYCQPMGSLRPRARP